MLLFLLCYLTSEKILRKLSHQDMILTASIMYRYRAIIDLKKVTRVTLSSVYTREAIWNGCKLHHSINIIHLILHRALLAKSCIEFVALEVSCLRCWLKGKLAPYIHGTHYAVTQAKCTGPVYIMHAAALPFWCSPDWLWWILQPEVRRARKIYFSPRLGSRASCFEFHRPAPAAATSDKQVSLLLSHATLDWFLFFVPLGPPPVELCILERNAPECRLSKHFALRLFCCYHLPSPWGAPCDRLRAFFCKLMDGRNRSWWFFFDKIAVQIWFAKNSESVKKVFFA